MSATNVSVRHEASPATAVTVLTSFERFECSIGALAVAVPVAVASGVSAARARPASSTTRSCTATMAGRSLGSSSVHSPPRAWHSSSRCKLSGHSRAGREPRCMASLISWVVHLPKGCWPVKIMYINRPNENVSVLGRGAHSVRRTSGAIQRVVPPKGRAPVVTKRLNPKSINFALATPLRFLSTSTFDALMSPWTMQGDWA
mmetsp:Transcript_111465/g.300687  ORF Transcript_111465/g.300687 Transcript_111465/m.300687 type:complete len:202 (+) Transcript_111465:139-744(+)